MKIYKNNTSFRLLLLLLVVFGLVSCDSRLDSENWPPLKATDKLVAPDPPAYPYSADAIAVEGDTLWVHSGEYFFKSLDAGNTWSPIEPPKRITASGMRASQDGQRILLFGQGGELIQSSDSGETWSMVELARVLDGLDKEYSYAEEDFWVDNALFDQDLNKMVIVAICHVFVSEDLGNTWRLLTTPKSFPKSGRREYCAFDVVLDKNFEPTHIAAEMTGSITTGDYVLRRSGDKWTSECTYDATLLLFDVAPDCGKLKSAQQTSQFNEYSKEEAWADENDLVDKIFHKQDIEYPKDFSLESLPYVVSDPAGERAWAITYKGIARTVDQGQNWTTLAGGVGSIDHEVVFQDGQRLAISDNKLYRSKDGIRWQLDKSIVEPYKMIATSNGAVILSSSIWHVKDSRTSVKQVIELSAHDLLAHKNMVWAHSGEVLAVSSDGGLNWITTELNDKQNFFGWECAEMCIFQKWKADETVGFFEAILKDGKLVIAEISQLNPGKNMDMNDSWVSSALNGWLIEFYDMEDDDSATDHWVSFDKARTWRKISGDGSESRGALFNNDAITFVTSSGIHSVTSNADPVTVASLPDLELGEVCTTEQGLNVVNVYDEHPETPSDELYTVLYSETVGREWYTTFTEYNVCEE